MYFPTTLKSYALGLAFSSAAFAQLPAPASPTPSVAAGAQAASPLSSVITQSSRVRAFDAGPGGEVRSLYLQNGSVVTLAPELGGQLAPVVRRGEKITVTGTRSQNYGQLLVTATSVRLNDKTFVANVPAGVAEGLIPPPPGASQAPPPAPPRRGGAAIPAPCAAPANAPPPPPSAGGPPPPPPNGVAPPPAPADGTVLPPPPPPLS